MRSWRRWPAAPSPSSGLWNWRSTTRSSATTGSRAASAGRATSSPARTFTRCSAGPSQGGAGTSGSARANLLSSQSSSPQRATARWHAPSSIGQPGAPTGSAGPSSTSPSSRTTPAVTRAWNGATGPNGCSRRALSSPTNCSTPSRYASTKLAAAAPSKCWCAGTASGSSKSLAASPASTMRPPAAASR